MSQNTRTHRPGASPRGAGRGHSRAALDNSATRRGDRSVSARLDSSGNHPPWARRHRAFGVRRRRRAAAPNRCSGAVRRRGSDADGRLAYGRRCPGDPALLCARYAPLGECTSPEVVGSGYARLPQLLAGLGGASRRRSRTRSVGLSGGSFGHPRRCVLFGRDELRGAPRQRGGTACGTLFVAEAGSITVVRSERTRRPATWRVCSRTSLTDTWEWSVGAGRPRCPGGPCRVWRRPAERRSGRSAIARQTLAKRRRSEICKADGAEAGRAPGNRTSSRREKEQSWQASL